jgi:hypothetical protein
LDDPVEAGHQHRDHPGPPGPDEQRDTCDHLDDAQRQQYPATVRLIRDGRRGRRDPDRGHVERDDTIGVGHHAVR